MSSGLAFQCQAIHDPTMDLCLNNGTCTLNAQQEHVCLCEPGWTGDFIAFHQPNCTMPTNALLGLLITSAIETAISLMAICKRARRTKGQVRRAAGFACLIVIFIFAQCVSMYIEGGLFIASPIFLGLVIVIASFWANELCELLAVPIFSMHPNLQRKVRKSLRLCFALIIFVNVAGCLAMSIVNATDDNRFNTIHFTYNILLFLCEAVFGTIVVVSGRELDRKIVDASLSSQIDTLRSKIWSMQFGALNIVFGQIPAVVASIVFAALGSAPYYWVIQFVIMLACSPSIAMATLGLMAKESEKSANANNVTLTASKVLTATTSDPTATL